jgi:hypothetical protein
MDQRVDACMVPAAFSGRVVSPNYRWIGRILQAMQEPQPVRFPFRVGELAKDPCGAVRQSKFFQEES